MRRAARLMALLIGCLVLQTSVMAQPSRNADDKRDGNEDRSSQSLHADGKLHRVRRWRCRERQERIRPGDHEVTRHHRQGSHDRGEH